MRDLDIVAAKCKGWLSDQVLPLWSDIGYREEGVFEEGVNSNKVAYSQSPIRFRVQPRQVYVFAHATELGWFEGTDIVKDAVANGFEKFRCETGEFIFSTTNTLEVNSDAKNAYEHAFAMLGYAWHYYLTRDSASLIKAEECYQWFETVLSDAENGGYFSSETDTSLRSQNPHMHLFEALMTLFEVTKEYMWLERASKIYDLFYTRFFNGKFLCEFFAKDLTPSHPDSVNVDPGHHYEWIWLLSHYSKLSGVDVSEQIHSLLSFAQKYGHSELGFVMDEIKDTGEKYRSTSRLWCQTELLKARVALYESNPTEENEVAISNAVDLIFHYYLEPANSGLWVDQIKEDGSPVSMKSPASTLYHIFLAFSEVWRISNN